MFVYGKEKDPAHITKKMHDALTQAINTFVWFTPNTRQSGNRSAFLGEANHSKSRKKSGS